MSEKPSETRLNQEDEQLKQRERLQQRDEEDAKPSPEQANGQADRNDRSEEDFETFDEDDDFDEFELHNWEPDQAAVEEEDLDWQDDWDMIDRDEDFAAKLAAELGQHGYTGGEQTAGMES